MHQLAILSTGWAVGFHSMPDGVHHSPFLFATDQCIFILFFWFLAIFPLDLTCHPVHFPTLISTTSTLVPYLLSPIDLATLLVT